MSGCPYCDEWRYDDKGPCIQVRQIGGSGLPVVWDGDQLRIGRGEEAVNPRRLDTARHICAEHPMRPEVLILGAVEEYAPLAAFNALMKAMAERPARSLLFGLGKKQRAEILALMD